MRVGSVMTKNVVTASPNDTLESVIEKFSKYHISGMPVVDSRKKVVGVVTESDVIKAIDAFNPKVNFDNDTSFALILAFLKHKKEIGIIKSEILGSEKAKVKSFMTKEVVSIGPEADMIEAARLMARRNVKRLVVLKNGRLAGIVARADIVRALGA